MHLYFARHGESEANIARGFSNRGFRHPLISRGVAQAEALAEALAERGIGRIYTSPLQRAVQTAEIIARATGAPVEAIDALREWDMGVYEGTSAPEGWAQHARVQEDWFVHGRPDSRVEGGESLLDVGARFVPFVEALLGADDGRAGDAVLIGHGGLYLAMLPIILPNVDRREIDHIPFDNAAYVLAEARPGEMLRCLEWCGAPLGAQ